MNSLEITNILLILFVAFTSGTTVKDTLALVPRRWLSMLRYWLGSGFRLEVPFADG